MKNYDKKVVKDFGSQWGFYKQNRFEKDLETISKEYFRLFPWQYISKNSCGFDMGCGSGRWAKFVAPKVKKLTCIDPSPEALKIAKINLNEFENIDFECNTTETCFLDENSQDFGYSLGVLHHIPNPKKGLQDCVSKLKKGSPILIYLYFNFENKNLTYRYIWLFSDICRKIISKLPFFLKFIITSLIATFVYFPFSKLALILERLNLNIDNIPLAEYRNKPFYVMLTDSLDRFGTKLEKRFSKKEIYELMKYSGLKDIKISDKPPYWLAVGFKA